ncbi:siderophore-interacting protein [Nocardioides sp. JQ2195]|uniref:siderophore-interacting protein n=1 Tax=Nocardioides sp. JQ2195 TaxID=2592334 RepID=UPI00143E47F3|nr:siderophore-interacting protein [Nocardioides sp. JQ2195]QIX25347.1 siderophore-interacting protein [Nocardioides sp. JQ2195]
MSTATQELPLILTEVEVTAVELISPTFVRIELASPALADFGVDGSLFDQRLKVVLPNDAGRLASFEGADESWFATWMDIPADERGHMRTYTVRDVRGEGADTRLVVDFVLHLAEGATGPGSAWAAKAQVGDRLVILAPRRGVPFGGIEFDPGTARNLLLVGDETAVPAIASILEDLPSTAIGTAVLEVPVAADVQELVHPEGVEVVWLPRDGAPHGEKQIVAVREHFGLAPTLDLVDDLTVDPDLWETPTYSSSGEALDDDAVVVGHDLAGLYAWIAGESKVVTTLRRVLVKELEVDRHQVAFMGYWRHGVAMRS